MDPQDPTEVRTHPVPDKVQACGIFPWLLVLCVGSGFAALIYEIVWFQLLELVIGSSAVSLGLLLGTFMGGMCLGSIALPRFRPTRLHPLALWAVLQGAIGVLAMVVLLGLPFAAQFYAAYARPGVGGLLLRGGLCAAFLLPPTILMGASLPAISDCVETTLSGVGRLGLLYAANTCGAVLGCLLAGFYLLRVHDMTVATLVAVVIDGIIAAAAVLLAPRGTHTTPVEVSAPACFGDSARRRVAYATIALSGLCALGAEVVWTRLLSLILGATVYTFSIVLAAYLSGLGIGSAAGASLARRSRSPALVLGVCQVMLTGAIAWAAYILCQSLPYWPIDPSLSRNVWVNFQLDLLRCLWAILPATCLWGASFPLALAAATIPGEDSGQLVGKIYAANTLGAILGALGCSLCFIGWIGTQQTQRLLVGLSAVSGCLMFLPSFAHRRIDTSSTEANHSRKHRIRYLAWAAVLPLAALLAWSVPKVPWRAVAYGRNLPVKPDPGLYLYVGEGLNASVAVSQAPTGQRLFHVSGKVEASTDPQDMRLQRMLGHLPALFHQQPRSVLVVGCGAGVTAGSFVAHPGIEKIVICEIEPLIPQNVVPFFAEENHHVLEDSRVRLVYDDARHYILRTQERFDIITSDPIHPWVKGAANLYTREYFQLCRQHLNPGGFVTQWVPLYESNLAAVKTQLATFFEVFPEGTLWSNDDLSGGGYDLVLLGQAEPMSINLDELQKRLHRQDHELVAQSLGAVGIKSAFALLTTYAGQALDLDPWLRGAEINRDRNLRLQYLAATAIGSADAHSIYAELLRYRRFPEGIFLASSVWNRALRQTFEGTKPKE